MSSNIKITMLCQFCGEEFTARTTVTKFCSHKCASSAYKRKKRDEKIQKAQKNTEESKLVNLNNTIPNKEYLSVLDTAQLLGIGRATVNRYCVSGKIPCMKINRKIFIRRKDIEGCFDNATPYEITPIVVYASLDTDTKQKLLTGMFVEAQLVADSRNALNVPFDAVTTEEGNNFLLVLESEKEGLYTFRKTLIKTGERNGDWIEIIPGEKFNSDIKILTKGVYDII